jgi:hypothetical protein
MSEEPQPTNKTYLLHLTQDEATMLWWALYEKQVQLDTRVKQFDHVNWPPEAKNAAIWEEMQLRTIRKKLEELEQ